LLQRARESGKCPPSLLTEDRVVDADGFEASVTRVLDAGAFSLASDANVAQEFSSVLQKVESQAAIPAGTDDQKRGALEQRRCLILAFVGATSSDSKSLEKILINGYLESVKAWLGDILAGDVGKFVMSSKE
jgi:hypothetical protein